MALPSAFSSPVVAPRASVSLRSSLRRSLCLQQRPLALTPSLAGLPLHASGDALLTLSSSPPRGGAPPSFRRDDRDDDWDPLRSLSAVGAVLATILARYSKQLMVAPVRTKAVTSGLLMMLSDYLAQVMTSPVLEAERLARFLVYGLLIAGPVTHGWYAILDRVVRTSGLRAAFAKMALDQLFMSHVFLVLFFGFMHLAEGRSVDSVHSTLAREHCPAFFASLKLWPMVNMVNFAIVPAAYRVVFGSAVNVGWVTFLSMSAAESGKPDDVEMARAGL